MKKVAVLVDISGTVCVEKCLTPNCREALTKLRNSSISHRFVTNTTKESKNLLLSHLNNLGLAVTGSDVFTALTAARDYVVENRLRPLLLVDDKALDEFTDIDVSEPNAVVIGYAPEKLNYNCLNKAFRLLLEGDAKLIAIHKSRYFMKQEGLCLGPGGFVEALEFASSRKAVVVGKPEREFFMMASSCFRTNNEPLTIYMIGDDARDDIRGAQNAGCRGILVKTGKYMPGDEEKIDPAPYAVTETLADAIDLILQSHM